MRKKQTRQNLYAVAAALIWGTAFVAQSVAADHVPAMAFTAARSAVAFLFLLLLCTLLGLRRKKRGGPMRATAGWRELLTGGGLCGAALTVASVLQQKGIEYTSVGKASFITALYIVLVPAAGILLKRKPPRVIWLCVALAVMGLYCLCMTESFTVSAGDIYVILCAFCFTVQIMLVDHFTQTVDGVELSCVQMLAVALLSALGSLLTETVSWGGLRAAMALILYVGVFSSGVAYTLQILAQKDAEPAVISLLLSLESVFGTVSGAVLLQERLSEKEYLGCVLMLVAVVLAQLPERRTASKAAE